VRAEVKIEPKSLAEFERAMIEYAYACRETIRDVGLKNAALMCRESMMLTPPMGSKGNGLKVQAQKAGEKTINRDVRKIYTAVDGRGIGPLLLVTQQLAYATRYGSPADFRSLLDGAKTSALKKGTKILRAIANDYDDERAFKKAKNYFNRSITRSSQFGVGYVQDLKPIHEAHLKRYNGRFLVMGKSVSPLRNWRNKHLVQDEQAIKEYVASRTPSVGKLKAGWYKVLMSLPKPSSRENKANFGTSGIPTYIKRHAGAAGYIRMLEAKDVFDLVIGNSIADMNKVSTEADVKSTVIGLRVKQLRLDLEQRLKKAADKASKR
jgi:uncharacterized protein (UPF0297 family)